MPGLPSEGNSASPTPLSSAGDTGIVVVVNGGGSVPVRGTVDVGTDGGAVDAGAGSVVSVAVDVDASIGTARVATTFGEDAQAANDAANSNPPVATRTRPNPSVSGVRSGRGSRLEA